MLSADAQKCLQDAVQNAIIRGDDVLTIEHVLFALLDDKDVNEIVSSCGGNVRSLKQQLSTHLDDMHKNVVGRMNEKDAEDPEEQNQPVTSLALQRLLQRVMMRVQSIDKREVETGNILVEIFNEKDSHATYFLERQGLRRYEVIRFFAHGLSRRKTENSSTSTNSSQSSASSNSNSEDERSSGESKGSFLKKFAVNLNEKAKQGKIDPIIGR